VVLSQKCGANRRRALDGRLHLVEDVLGRRFSLSLFSPNTGRIMIGSLLGRALTSLARRLGRRPPTAVAALVLCLASGSCDARTASESEAPGDRGEVHQPPPILYTAIRNANGDLFNLEAGQFEERLTTDPASDNFGRWSPDGFRVAFQTRRNGPQSDIYLLDVVAGTVEPLVDDPAFDILPAWSPDGSRVAFMSTRGFELGSIGPFPGHVYVVNVDGTGLRRVTHKPLTSALGPSDWSPDGRALLIARENEDTGIDLYTLDVESGEERVLLAGPDNEYGASYSPDGSRVALHVESAESAKIAVLSLLTHDLTDVSWGTGRRYNPRWSPDGNWLAFASEGADGRYDIAALRLADRVQVPIAITDQDERDPDWRP